MLTIILVTKLELESDLALITVAHQVPMHGMVGTTLLPRISERGRLADRVGLRRECPRVSEPVYLIAQEVGLVVLQGLVGPLGG